jgi:3-phosphoshikimate 1-carboxyvinyltransferase
MEKVSIVCRKKNIEGNISLPSSKSITNRALILEKISESKIRLNNCSSAEDSVILSRILKSSENIIDVGHAGTAMRFLTAFYATREGREIVLTGSERMKKRPVRDLVDALNSLGAEITYLENDGFPPLKIIGKNLLGGNISIRGDISSQFISALLLISPLFEKGLTINITEKAVSLPYIEMTVSLLKQCGGKVNISEKCISVEPFNIIPAIINVEADWSAAAFFYQIAALSESADIFLKGLQKESLQGDAVLPDIFTNLGVTTTFHQDGIQLKKVSGCVHQFNFDFSNSPDLAQSVAVTMAALGIKGKLAGLSTLRIKETDRIAAVVNELQKFGLNNIEAGNDFLIFNSSEKLSKPEFPISVYDDHRMAMAFAPLALITEEIFIEDPETVKKSFPDYWKRLEEMGFAVDKR